MGGPWSLLLLAACDRAPSSEAAPVPPWTTLALGEPERVDGLASMDAGGEPILVVATTTPTSLRWFSGAPGLDASPGGEIALARSGPLLTPGDLDQDGYPDLVLAAEEDRVDLLIFAGGPAGPATEPLVTIGTSRTVDADRLPRTAHGLGAGDFDADGVPDIAVGSHAYWGLKGVSVYSGVDPAFAAFVRDDCYGFGEAVAGTGDVDADGYDDAVASGFCGVQAIFGGAESLATVVDHGAQMIECHGPGDLDDDGFADVLCADGSDDHWDYVPTLALYRGSPTGLLEPTQWSTWLDWVDPPAVVRRETDHDGNGAADLVIGWPDADMQQGGVLVYAGGTSEVRIAIPGRDAGLFLGDEVVDDLDLDLDGRPDIVTTTTAVLRGSGPEEARVYRGADLGGLW